MGTVVFFNHPGGEHVARHPGETYPWSTRPNHLRKYLSVQAQLALSDRGAFRRDQPSRPVSLWGEYEAPTTGHRFEEPDQPGMPESWHTLLPIGTAPAHAQNTDPWIFGETFRYVYCMQPATATSYLRRLVHGDLLLFGSYIRRDTANKSEGNVFDFYLDTVFVVDQARFPNQQLGHPRALFDPPHERATYNRLPAANRDDCTFYTGVMLGHPPSKLPFSYSPCVATRSDVPRRARRPMVSDLFAYSTRNPQTFRRFEDVSAADAWRKVLVRCLEQGCDLAVKVEDATLEPGAEDGGAPGGECH